jgi:hypothetical protein
MNIFATLAQGKGSINEENISSFFAYLMMPDESHGLKREFLFRFFKELDIDDKFFDIDEYSYEILLEQPYNKVVGTTNKNRTIDIQVNINAKDDNILAHTIAIENKIKVSAVNPNQLLEEYKNIKHSLKDKIGITMVFLSPDGTQYKNEFEKLAISKADRKKWITWEKTTEILKNILKAEENIDIEPLAEDTKHIIKAFIYFVQTNVLKKANKDSAEVRYFSSKAAKRGIIVEYKDIGKYELLMFKDAAIRIKDLNGRDGRGYVVKDMLRDVFKTLNMVKKPNDDTRAMGRHIFQKDIRKPIKITLSNPKFSPNYTSKGSNELIIDD